MQEVLDRAMTAIAIQRKPEILERLANGHRLIDIAADLGLKTHSAIVNVLADDPEYRAAREVGALVRIETRETEMESADDSVTVARARELLSHARWRAEREFPARWGQKTETKVDATLKVEVVRFAQDVGKVIEHQALDEKR
jgi:hypothetical protein